MIAVSGACRACDFVLRISEDWSVDDVGLHFSCGIACFHGFWLNERFCCVTALQMEKVLDRGCVLSPNCGVSTMDD